jgi:serine/threonine protein phosphatase PrpC
VADVTADAVRPADRVPAGRPPAPPVDPPAVPPAPPGVPDTVGDRQRAADAGTRLFRGSGVHAPDTAIDAGLFEGLDVRAASVRGTYGRYTGTPRQDDYALGASADGCWLVVAVADGLSSASASHLGATLAARTAVQQAERLLDEAAAAGDAAPSDAAPLDVAGVFQSAAYQLRRAAEPLLTRAGREVTPSAISDLFATTLVLAVVPTAAAGSRPGLVARVGDSGAWRLDAGGWLPLLAPKPLGPVATAATASLPSLPDTVEHRPLRLRDGQVLVLATDGVTDPMGADGATAAGRYLARAWSRGLPPPLEFARHVSYRGRSWDDDRTAVAVAWATAS